MADAQSREKLIELTGQMSIPVIVVDDQVVQGFNKPKLKSLLVLSRTGGGRPWGPPAPFYLSFSN